MKHTIHHIFRGEVLEDRLVLHGQGGKIVLALYEPKLLRVSYRFDHAPAEPEMQKGSDFITQSKSFMPWTGELVERESDFEITLPQELLVRVEKSSGIVSLFQRGVLLHGGHIGSDDLVVPEYPVRLIEHGGRQLVRYNFPLKAEDEFYGLGDKGGYPDRRGLRFSMFNRDSLGYDASNSDPLYKSVPFFIKVNRSSSVCLGLLFPMSGVRVLDFGRESPFYYMAEADGGPFDYCLFAGDHYAQIMEAYCRLTGFPELAPLYSFGFLGSSMNYLEPDDAPQRVLDYFERTEREDIPCEGMYFSSGYLKANDGKRYAFIWNKDKFPDHGAYMRALTDRGYHIMMNLKPGILVSHPWYQTLDQKGFFIKDAQGNTYVEYFWGGAASFIDFTNPLAKEWWKEQIKVNYLDYGCSGIWNDNNELELEDTQLPVYQLRSQYPVLMAQASWEAMKEREPELRPWVYSRAGSCGLQRYSRTWTGDNASDFKTLRFNQYMGLSLGLSGMPYYGHDLGGFFGEFPEEELLLRSCETAVFQPRFVIHSWRENGIPTEPWSYPGALKRIRELIHAHYHYMPYIYDCAVQAALCGYPMERMLRLEFPDDPELSSNDTNMMFGPYILKVQAVERGQSLVDVRLPARVMWYDPRESKVYQGGQMIQKAVPIDGQPHFMLRLGAVIPTAKHVKQLATALFDQTQIQLYPCVAGEKTVFDHYEDDGQTDLEYKRYNHFQVTLDSERVQVKRLRFEAPAAGGGRAHTLLLPEGYVFEQTGERTFIYDPDSAQFDFGSGLRFTGRWE